MRAIIVICAFVKSRAVVRNRRARNFITDMPFTTGISKHEGIRESRNADIDGTASLGENIFVPAISSAAGFTCLLLKLL